MKKYFLFCLVFITFNFISYGQCPTTDITLSTQAEVDAFTATYPGCTELTDSLYITGSDITNLNGLSGITSVGFYFQIENADSLINLEGLNSLTYVGFCKISNNDNLTSLSGLNSLVQAPFEIFEISDNVSLVSIEALQNLEEVVLLLIYNNDLLMSIDGLEGLTTAQLIDLKDNDVLEDIDAIENLDLDQLFNLRIENNINLSFCSLENICNYLANEGQNIINNNDIGCNSEAEIINVCNEVVAYPPSDLVICDDDNDGIAEFDLTVTESEIIGGQDPTGLVITFYITQADAINAINQIINSSEYTNISNPQSIYVRLEDSANGEYDTTSFDLIVHNLPVPITPTPLEVCDDDNDGFVVFTLTDKDEEIIGGEPGVIVSYYETQPDAELGLFYLTSPYVNIITPIQTIYVRVYNPDTDCYTIVVLELHVLPTPEIIAVTDYIIFDENNDGVEIFDLTTKIPEILNGQNDVEVTFYETQQDAINYTNALANPTAYPNISNPQTIFTRLENLESCYSVGSFVIFADPDLGITQNLYEDLKIYPNPTKRMLNVEVNGLILEEIAIINLQGMVLKNVSNKNEIDVSSLATGIYFIQMSLDGNTVTKKFIKE